VGFDQQTWKSAAEAFAVLVERQASKRAFLDWFLAFHPPKGLSATDWMEVVPPVAEAVNGLGWMTPGDRDYVSSRILDFVQQAFTELWPSGCQPDAALDAMKGFMTWVESQPDDTVVRFCWELMSFDRTFTPAPVWALKHSGRLAGAISYDSLELAVALWDEAETMYWWPEERWAVMSWDAASTPYTKLLSHDSYLVRAAAAMALGRLFFGLHTKTESRIVPALSNLLVMIRDRERITPGVAGPFLCGAVWGIAPDEWSSFADGFDMESWFIQTLRHSGQEREVPHIQSLEFYAHELFSDDANAIREFLMMGRKELAVMTATDRPSAIPDLLPVLEEMSASSDPEIAAAIREYLSVKTHHAGMQHLNK